MVRRQMKLKTQSCGWLENAPSWGAEGRKEGVVEKEMATCPMQMFAAPACKHLMFWGRMATSALLAFGDREVVSCLFSPTGGLASLFVGRYRGWEKLGLARGILPCVEEEGRRGLVHGRDIGLTLLLSSFFCGSLSVFLGWNGFGWKRQVRYLW